MIFKTQPSDFKKEIEVAGCFVGHGGEILLLHRQSHKTNGNKWGMPAGKLDEEETSRRAVAREVFEETGISLPEEQFSHFDSVFVRNEEHDLIYHIFSARLEKKPEVKLAPKEHQDFVWVSPSKALEMDLIHDLDGCIDLFYLKSL